MAIDVELKTSKQNNTTWPSTFKASNRFPIVANRVFATLEKAQQYVDDTAADASAYVGIVLAVVQDEIVKNNGVYYVSSVAMNEDEKGTLVKVGGTETETAEDYSKAVELSKTLTVGQLIKVEKEYKENEGQENEITYQKGFYIVEGSGIISALSTSTGADDEIGALKSRVDSIEGVIGDADSGLVKDVADLKAIDHDAYIAADNVLKGELQGYTDQAKSDAIAKAEELDAAMNTRVEALEAIDHEHENKGVLDGITAEKVEAWDRAQANVIEKIKFNGTEVVVDNQTKTVELNTPADFISGLTEDKVLTVTDGKLSATLGLNYFSSGDTYEIQLVGKDNEVIGRIDAKDFVKDGMLNNVELKKNPEGQTEGTYLVFTWNNEAGVTDPMYVPVTDLIDVYDAGNGLDLNGKTFSISLKANEKYLEVTEGGLATKGIDDAITTAKNALLGEETDDDTKNTIYGAKAYAKEQGIAAQETAIAEAKTYSEEAYTSATTYADATFVKLADFNEFSQELEDKLTNIEAGAEVNVIESVVINDITATTVDKIATVNVNADNIKVGANITNDKEVVYSGDTKVSAVLQGIQDSLNNAINNSLTGVVAGDGVEVSGVNENKQTISAKISTDENNMLKLGTDRGLFVAMYYDGDDAE